MTHTELYEIPPVGTSMTLKHAVRHSDMKLDAGDRIEVVARDREQGDNRWCKEDRSWRWVSGTSNNEGLRFRCPLDKLI